MRTLDSSLESNKHRTLEELERESNELIKSYNHLVEQFQSLHLESNPSTEVENSTAHPLQNTTLALIATPAEVAGKKIVDKTWKTHDQARAMGVPFISRMYGNDKRTFPLKKSRAKTSELSDEAVIALRMDIKESEIQHKDLLIHEVIANGSIPNALAKFKYDSKKLQTHYRVSRSKVSRIKNESFALDHIKKLRKGRKPLVTLTHVSYLYLFIYLIYYQTTTLTLNYTLKF